MGALLRDLCKMTVGLVRSSAVSGNSIGDRLVGEPAVTGPWLGECRLGKPPEKLKENKEILCMHVSVYCLCTYKEHSPFLKKAKYLQLNDKLDFHMELSSRHSTNSGRI